MKIKEGVLPPKTGVVTKDNCDIGDRVLPGPDWRFEGQNGGTVGIITATPLTLGVGLCWVRVMWDNGREGHYRISPIHELVFAE